MNTQNISVPSFVVVALAGLVAGRAGADDMFPFHIPGLGAPAKGSVVDVSWLNNGPAGQHGFVSVKEGRFVDGGGKRIRFLATNFTFASCFPDHDAADQLAARLASLGINCICFHHMDNQVAPRGIWKPKTPKRNELDPDQMDRLDYFIAALKRHGVYADINLHVSREYWEGEDFPDGLNSRQRREQMPHYGHGVDKINDQMIRMQRQYARMLLTHVNRYTKTAYAHEPCVAIVEINNENSLLQLKMANLPDYYRNDILKKWNTWLKDRYASDAKLQAAWGGSQPLGKDLLSGKWRGQQPGQGFYEVHSEPDGSSRVSIHKLPKVAWQLQIHQTGLTLDEGGVYTLAFRGRSDKPRRLPLDVRLQQEDWHNCGLAESVELAPQWQEFSYTFRARRVVPAAVRVSMVLGGGPTGDFWIKDMTLRSGGSLGLRQGESLLAGNVADSRSPGTTRHADWVRFLAETERAYTNGMRRFLKEDLGVRANIIDTQASYGNIPGCYRESFNDYVDMHAYWQHPRFPGRPWDGNNWLIPNTPMVAAKDTGNFARLAAYRVAGKPFTVSEYDHPAPSHYTTEAFPMIASFAAVQDWDGLFQFDWGGTDWNSGRIAGYFSLQQHPGKLAFLPAAAMMFRRGDVAPAKGEVRLDIPAGQVEKLEADGVSMPMAWKQAGVEPRDALARQLAVRFSQDGELKAHWTESAASQVAWDEQAAIYTVNAPAAKAVVGRCTGKATRLGDVEFDIKANARDFAVLTLNTADGRPIAQSDRLLLVAAGNVENTGMGWNAEHTSVGTRWGKAPTICEGIAAKITLPTEMKTPRVFALDGRGARLSRLRATFTDGKLQFEIGPKLKTLWFEIAAE